MDVSPVIHHSYFGPALPSLNWVPAPRYVLRRDRVLSHLKDVSPCRILDIGCGPGALISELSTRGFEVYGVDRSPNALEVGQQLKADLPRMTLRSDLDEKWKGSFDIVMCFEVIEHIDDDVGAMRNWRDYLKPGGSLILSVPAHQRRWNAADEWAGHVRRYERRDLINAVEHAGFKIESIECYGFPLANLMEVLRAYAYGKRLNKKNKSSKSSDELTTESGTDRSVDAKFWPLYSSAPSALAMRFFCWIQRQFLNTDLGNGFLVVAERPD